MRLASKVTPVGTVIALILLVCCAAAVQSAALLVKDGDPNTIGAAIARSDGETISLTSEWVVWRGQSGKSFAIKEPWEKASAQFQPRIVVVSTKPLPVQAWWTVDVTGILLTREGKAPDGGAIVQRSLVVSPSDVLVYCDLKGRPCPFPPIKGEDFPGITKRPLSDLAASATDSTASGMTTMDSGGELPPPGDPPPAPDPPAAGSKDTLKHLPDGAQISVSGAIVSASFSGFFYTERSDRSFGIRINSNYWAFAGDLVDVTGKMTTVGGERAVIADSVTNLASGLPVPTTLGLNTRWLGGGAVDAYTPAVGDGAGLNNTGLLVRLGAKVTAADSGTRVYTLSDGATGPSGNVSVKVYDYGMPWDPFPNVGDFQIADGVSSCEIPQGQAASIRVLRQTNLTPPTYETTNGTISGTVTAVGANGKTVKVYCARASTTATFTGDTTNYSLTVPYGDHAVTATMQGFKTTTQLVNVSSFTPNPTADFTLPAIGRRIDVVAAPPRIPPDGATQTTITIIARDEEGRRYGNETVTWNVDLGTVISSDPTTDTVGEARLVLQAPSSPGTANVSATVGGTTSTGYVEFALPTAPSVRIVAPTLNETVSGTVTVRLEASDPGGANPGVVELAVTVDGQPLGVAANFTPNRTPISVETEH